MKERCIYAYRKRGKAAVFCKLIEGGDYNSVCGHQYMCNQTKRWEVNNSAQCSLRQKAITGEGQKENNATAEEKLVETTKKAKKSTAKAKK